jgi:hypothetical protein
MLAAIPAGENPAGGTCPVATVVISGDGRGDPPVGSPEVEVSVGWARARSGVVVHRQSPLEDDHVCHAIPGQIDSPRTRPAIALEVSVTREALIWTPRCDVGQTSLSAAAVSLSYRSVGSSDLYLRQVPSASEWRGHEVESRSDLGSSRHPWCRTSALGRVPVSRLEAPAAVGRSSSMEDLIRRRAAY